MTDGGLSCSSEGIFKIQFRLQSRASRLSRPSRRRSASTSPRTSRTGLLRPSGYDSPAHNLGPGSGFEDTFSQRLPGSRCKKTIKTQKLTHMRPTCDNTGKPPRPCAARRTFDFACRATCTATSCPTALRHACKVQHTIEDGDYFMPEGAHACRFVSNRGSAARRAEDARPKRRSNKPHKTTEQSERCSVFQPK